MAQAPIGRASKDNPFFAKENHVQIARLDRNKQEFFGTIGGTVPTDPVIVQPLFGPFTLPSGSFFWIREESVGVATVGFNSDADPEPDIFVTPEQVAQNTQISAQDRRAIRTKLTGLGY